MRICYIYQDQYPWDIRVDKITSSLADHGIEAHIISRNRDGLCSYESTKKNIFIHRLPSFKNITLRNIFNFPVFFSPIWIYKTLSVVKNHNIDLIIVRDLPLTATAIIVGKLTKIPVMMDMAENYPAMISDTWKYRGPKNIDYIIRNPWFLRKLEAFILPKLDAILVVSNHSAERVGKLGVVDSKISVVSNTPNLINMIKLKQDVVNTYRKLSDFIILYVGGLEETRGLKSVVLALPQILELIPHALFCVVGQGTSEKMLKVLANQLGVLSHIYFAGWQDQHDVPSIIAASDVCIVPHYVTEHTDTTIPNKIFDYMAQKKPVIVTNAKSLVEIVVNNTCGKVYSDNDSNNLVKTIVELHDRKLSESYGENGYIAIHDKYNWKVDENILLNAVQNVVTTSSKE